MTPQEEGKAHMGKWMNWLAIMGFLIVDADDMEAAVKIA